MRRNADVSFRVAVLAGPTPDASKHLLVQQSQELLGEHGLAANSATTPNHSVGNVLFFRDVQVRPGGDPVKRGAGNGKDGKAGDAAASAPRAPGTPPPAEPPSAGATKTGGSGGWSEMTDEQKAGLRKKMESMTDEQKAEFRKKMRERAAQ